MGRFFVSMEKLSENLDLIKSLKLINWDRGVLALTGVLSYLSISVESLNLYLAVVLKMATIINIGVYLLLNRERIIEKVKAIFNKKNNG